MRRSTKASRLARTSAWSATNAWISSAEGGRPVRSRLARRMKSKSVQRPDGAIFMRCHLAATSSSILLHTGGFSHAKPVRSPMTVRVVAV